ncbi:hypothetical protein BpHYR1_044370 [Brachionus plicatilis]|uniref:Uncharacterized protein n=1 Tax=Brachionus plicatilis TaxID=10195 RepID=A0A3M7SSS8_BRAPC|nr:hypothetical protein BpHYR1_044370 [Brachionus plicatilis]
MSEEPKTQSSQSFLVNASRCSIIKKVPFFYTVNAQSGQFDPTIILLIFLSKIVLIARVAKVALLQFIMKKSANLVYKSFNIAIPHLKIFVPAEIVPDILNNMPVLCDKNVEDPLKKNSLVS